MDLSNAYSILKNVYVNFSKVNNCFYVYKYRPEYDPTSKRTLKKDVMSIGKIRETDGLGRIEFNSKFLNIHPEFASLKILRTGKNTIHIEEPSTDNSYNTDNSSNTDNSRLLEARHMKVGATYFIKSAFMKSYSGRALKALYNAKTITKTQFEQLLSLFIYSIYEGVKHLDAIEFFIRDHIVPYKKNINKYTVQRLFDLLNSELIVAFYKKKHEIMQADCSKYQSSLSKRHYIALDGTNIDVNSSNINNADFGHAKSGNSVPVVNFLSLIDQYTGTLMGHCSYSGHTADIATLEGAIKQLAYYGCKDYTVIVDRGYWSLYNLNVMYNIGLQFIVHVKQTHGTLKTFINNIIDDMAVGNGCIKIKQNNETNYAACFEKQWSYHDVKKNSKVRKPIYLYAFYNPDLTAVAKEALIDQVRALNEEYVQYKQDLNKAILQHKKKPEMPSLSQANKDLLESGVIYLNTTHNRYDIDNAKAISHCQAAGIWILASSEKLSCEEVFMRYRQRNEIEVMYRYLKNHVEADTLKVSNEQHFNAKLFTALIASEFLNATKLKIMDWNKHATAKEKVQLKDNSMYMTFKDLDTLECIYHDDTIITTTNILKRHENLFAAMSIDPVVLQNTKLKQGTLEEGNGLIL